METYNLNERLAFKTPASVRAEITGITHYHMHLHSTCTELICVLRGEVTVYDFAVPYTLHPGEIHCMNSNDPHRIESNDPDSIILMVQFDKQHYVQYFPALSIGYFVTHMLDPQWANYSEMRYLRFLMSQIYFEYIKDNPSDLTLEQLTREMIQLLYDSFHDYIYYKLKDGGYIIIRRRNEGQKEEDYIRVYRIADYLESHVGDKITLEDAAAEFYLNKAYLSSIIKKNIGVTFSELQSIARCSEVERQLVSSDRSIDLIAENTGFANRGHLTTQFRKWYMVSPSQYRRQLLDDFQSGNVVNYHPFDPHEGEALARAYLNG